MISHAAIEQIRAHVEKNPSYDFQIANGSVWDGNLEDNEITLQEQTMEALASLHDYIFGTGPCMNCDILDAEKENNV